MKKAQEESTRECEDCGEFIAKERLRAIPDAVLCIVCAEETERRWGFKAKTMEVVVNGQNFDDYDGYEEFLTAGKWRKPRPK